MGLTPAAALRRAAHLFVLAEHRKDLADTIPQIEACERERDLAQKALITEATVYAEVTAIATDLHQATKLPFTGTPAIEPLTDAAAVTTLRCVMTCPNCTADADEIRTDTHDKTRKFTCTRCGWYHISVLVREPRKPPQEDQKLHCPQCFLGNVVQTSTVDLQKCTACNWQGVTYDLVNLAYAGLMRSGEDLGLGLDAEFTMELTGDDQKLSLSGRAGLRAVAIAERDIAQGVVRHLVYGGPMAPWSGFGLLRSCGVAVEATALCETTEALEGMFADVYNAVTSRQQIPGFGTHPSLWKGQVVARTAVENPYRPAIVEMQQLYRKHKRANVRNAKGDLA